MNTHAITWIIGPHVRAAHSRTIAARRICADKAREWIMKDGQQAAPAHHAAETQAPAKQLPAHTSKHDGEAGERVPRMGAKPGGVIMRKVADV